MNLTQEKPIKSAKKPKKVKKPKEKTLPEILAESVFVCLGLEFQSEFKFFDARKWKADYCLPSMKILIEIEGGVWNGGRHINPTGFINDCEKYNKAAMMGFKVLRYPAHLIENTRGENILSDLKELKNAG